MDVLSDILDTLRFRTCFYFTTDFRPPWGVAVPAFGNVARFHLVMSGSCWVRIGQTGTPFQMHQGDLILIPHGAAHVLSDVPNGPVLDVGDIVRDHGLDTNGCLVFGGDNADGATRLVCGHFEFDEGENPLMEALPPQIVLRRQISETHGWLKSILTLVAEEATSGRAGGEFVLKRLTDVLFVQTIRAWHEQQGEHEQGLLAAIADRHVGRSLRAVHEKTEAPWTVETMAREAGLSRTVFAERFRELVGQSPMTYVTSWRMHRARLLLAESDYSIDRIAAEVGYQSPASFARVFRKVTGESPGSVRRASHEASLH